MKYNRTMWVVVAAMVWCAQVNTRAEPIGTAFTYQGQLKQGGVPVDGQANFLFRLYDAETDGTLIDDVVCPLVEVADGQFTVQLDFDAGVFDGSALWLDVVVEHPAGAQNWTILSPRQPITPAPYALYSASGPCGTSEHWAANDEDIHNTNAGNVGIGTTTPNARLHVTGDASRTARFTNESSSGGVAVAASAPARSGYATAVDAYASSPTGVGVYAFNEAESGNAYALQGETASPDGIAVFGNAGNSQERSTGIGVYGRSRSDYGGTGVYGETTNTGNTYGVRGVSQHGTGVRGDNKDTGNFGSLGRDDEGVYGMAVDQNDVGVRGVHQSTTNYGLLGTSLSGVYGNSDQGYAGYFHGRGYFSGRLGIGELNPDHALNVNGNLEVNGWIGTDEEQTVTFRTHNQVALRLEPAESPECGFVPNVIGGYSGNYAATGEQGAFIGGGGCNASIGGDRPNRVVGGFGTIAGGENNEAGIGSFVGGGISNTSGNTNIYGLDPPPWGSYATVGGGQSNKSLGFCASVGGGAGNLANGEESTIAGGAFNIAGDANDPPYTAGRWTTVGGGNCNYAQARGSTIPGGSYAVADVPYQLAYAAGNAWGDAVHDGNGQTSTYILRGSTNSGSTQPLDRGSWPLIIPDGQTWAFDILIAARRDDGVSAGYQITGVVKRAGATTAFAGTPRVMTLGEEEEASPWGASVRIKDSFDDHRLEIVVTGANDMLIRWIATVRTTEVEWPL